METLKVGFIGAGFIARFQAIALKTVRGVEIAGITKRKNSEDVAAFVRDNGLGDCKIYPTIAELCENASLSSRK